MTLFSTKQVASSALAVASAAPSAPPTAPPSALRKLHVLLRGRYRLALGMAAGCAVAGAMLAVSVSRPAVESNGMIEIKALVPTPNDWDKVMPMYNAYVSSVVAKLQSERVLKAAIASRAWQACRPGSSQADLAHFSKALVVKYVPNTELIELTYTDNRRDSSAVAPIAIKAVINAYVDLFADQDMAEVKQKVEYWIRRQRLLQSQIDDRTTTITALAKDYGDDLSFMVNAKLEDIVRLEGTVREADGMLASAQSALAAAERGDPNRAYTPEDIARADPLMAEQIKLRNEIEMQLQEALATLGPRNPRTVEAVDILKIREKYIQQYADQIRARYLIRWHTDVTGNTVGSLVPKDLSELQATVKRLHDTLDRAKATVADLSSRQMQIQTARTEIAQFQQDLADASKHREDFEYQTEMSGQFNVLSDGDSAATASDKRPMMATAGFLAGGGLPIGVLMLLAAINPRIRYSDEADEMLRGINLLGTLPELPGSEAKNGGDEEAAEIAAQCVHQIRTMLQLYCGANAGSETRGVFAITSAGPGDGKTSLTLALGLSYAACGTRTLLIDCDLIGAGLTARLQAARPTGILEAVAAESLLPFVHATDLPYIRLLPVGLMQQHRPATLSPASLRRLVEEARTHFDVILIDTGPLLGGIEAPLACSAADGVVLTVARNQPHAALLRAITHLHMIGARLAGCVFNRAEPADLARSRSSPKLRLTDSAAGNARAPIGIGPLATAVRGTPAGASVHREASVA
jgi:Mrp family chromosome partitioning ATPase/flagellin-like hook-associated protein FlgL